MSYYTEFDLHVSPRKDGISFQEGYLFELGEAIENLGVFEEGSYQEGYYRAYTKWNDYEKDMIALSKKFPDALFELSGDGEEPGDFWIEYFCGGRYQHCPGEIVYQEPNMAALIGEDPHDPYDDANVDACQIENLLHCVWVVYGF